ncbi:RNA polymerase factor sigma-54 [Pullulanibacillus sp. KACC 23026]|uniref:RNA polymerase factor sigma-54 n=1 Tax=Pullulanibacillus sp. KACC 23026 TaxID=3028315 RepID=UPI0023B00F37|nr:RNA polymerase factor sigma-54 [Pullulanibacillus sp. KACC 23026]WEG13636.1 RNA polymerase factor sigma-54 [Pullulanibacillus sp. KACC 23026]
MELKQTLQQQMKMAPMLFEAISLLQYNQVDLNAFLKEKTLENPLLDYQEADIYADSSFNKRGTGVSATDVLENTMTKAESFREDLKQQIRVHPLSELNQACAFNMVDNLNDKGYWVEDTKEWALTMGYPVEEVEASLRLLQSLEPAGVGATSLQHCLLLQAERLIEEEELSSIVQALIQDYLAFLADEDWEALSEQMGISIPILLEAYERIKQLSPYPITEMNPEPIQFIIPDLLLEEREGRFRLKVDLAVQPKLTINRDYYNQLLDATRETKERSYVHQKFSEAEWLLRGLNKREETLFRIAEALSRFHASSFAFPPEKWMPLTLKEIADQLDLHESTISRAVKGKYVRTPYGILELKRFFPKGVRPFGTHGLSSDHIKSLMRERIINEDPSNPLSDQVLANWFRTEHDLSLSRRVIAKYRTELGIESSMKRRQRK